MEYKDCAHLAVTRGRRRYSLYPLEYDVCTLGSAPGHDVYLPFEEILPSHLVFEKKADGSWFVEPVTDDVYYKYNRRQTNGGHRLQDGDVVEVGGERLLFFHPLRGDIRPPEFEKYRYRRRKRLGRLSVATGHRYGIHLLDEPTTTIGSAPYNHIVLPYSTVSASHCKIKRNDDHYELVDLDSTNGTWIGTSRIRNCRLEDGDKIIVPPVELLFEERELEAPRRKTPIEVSLQPRILALLMLAALMIVAGTVLALLGLGRLLGPAAPPAVRLVRTYEGRLLEGVGRDGRSAVCIIDEDRLLVPAGASGPPFVLDGMTAAPLDAAFEASPEPYLLFDSPLRVRKPDGESIQLPPPPAERPRSAPAGGTVLFCRLDSELWIAAATAAGVALCRYPWNGGWIEVPFGKVRPSGRRLYRTGAGLFVLTDDSSSWCLKVSIRRKKLIPVGLMPLWASDDAVSAGRTKTGRFFLVRGGRSLELPSAPWAAPPCCCCDLDGDGRREIVVSFPKGKLEIRRNLRDGAISRTALEKGMINRASAADMDRDGKDELYVPLENDRVLVYAAEESGGRSGR